MWIPALLFSQDFSEMEMRLMPKIHFETKSFSNTAWCLKNKTKQNKPIVNLTPGSPVDSCEMPNNIQIPGLSPNLTDQSFNGWGLDICILKQPTVILLCAARAVAHLSTQHFLPPRSFPGLPWLTWRLHFCVQFTAVVLSALCHLFYACGLLVSLFPMLQRSSPLSTGCLSYLCALLQCLVHNNCSRLCWIKLHPIVTSPSSKLSIYHPSIENLAIVLG